MSQPVERRVAVAFLAHPDDAEILCGGTLIRLSEVGWEVHIATATAGDCGSASLAADDIARVRRQEGTAAAARIGASYHCLEERDLRVVFDRPTIQKSIDLFRRLAPTLVLTHARSDYMTDHEQVHQLARSASFGYSIPNASSLPRVDGSAIPWIYYCDPLEGIDPYTGQRVIPTTFVDISRQIEQKTEMLVCHASQREWLRSHHGVDEYVAAMKLHGVMRGAEIGVPYGEAFIQHRGHAYPQQDLLTELFGGGPS